MPMFGCGYTYQWSGTSKSEFNPTYRLYSESIKININNTLSTYFNNSNSKNMVSQDLVANMFSYIRPSGDDTKYIYRILSPTFNVKEKRISFTWEIENKKTHKLRCAFQVLNLLMKPALLENEEGNVGNLYFIPEHTTIASSSSNREHISLLFDSYGSFWKDTEFVISVNEYDEETEERVDWHEFTFKITDDEERWSLEGESGYQRFLVIHPSFFDKTIITIIS